MRPQPATISDIQLIQRIGRASKEGGEGGDPAAIAALYDRYAGILLALALRIIRDRTEAEDIVHDAFVLIGARAHRYVPERGSVVAWVVTLVRNLAIDRQRRRERRGAIARDILAYEPDRRTSGMGSDPESQMVGATEAARVRRALECLPAVQRTTLELSFYSGLSYPEIAAKEKLPIGTIKSRAARALIALREALAADIDARG